MCKRNKQTFFNSQRKVFQMKALKIGVANYRSRSARVKVLLRTTNMSQSEIARKCGITPQTVNRIRDIMAGLYVQKG